MQTRRLFESTMAALLVASLATGVLPHHARAEAQALRPLRLPTLAGMTAEAARKIDPRLLLALAQPEKSAASLQTMGKRLPILGTGPADLRFPVLIRSSLTDRELAELGAAPDSRAGNITTAEVREQDVARLASDSRLEVIEASYWLHPTLDVSVPEIRAPQVWNGSPGYTGEGVLLGLLDDGVDVNHQDFLDPSGGSRIRYIWDHFRDGNAPNGFNYGKQYTKAQIDANQADEFQDIGGHGAHVASTAVGDGSSNANKYRGVAWEAEIVAVRNSYCDLFCYGGGVPPWGDADSKGSVDGLNYLLQKRDELGKPMVVNQSQGVMMGPHDGSTLLEQAYNNLVSQNNLIICIAAGNDEEAGWHGQKTVTNGSTATFQMSHVAQQGFGQPFLNLEGWTKQGDRCHWQLVTPSAETLDIPATTAGNQVLGVIAPAHQDTIFYYASATHAVNNQGYLNLFIQNRSQGCATGTWQLKATAEAVTAGGKVDVYLERNQYQFSVTGDALNLDSIVGMPGTASGAITVASYTTKVSWVSQDGTVGPNPPPTIGEISSFSSWGPRRDGAQKPDIAAPGEWIMAVKAAEHEQAANQTDTDGVHMIISGTSMATPHVAGVIALMLEKKPNLTATEIKTILAQTARHDAFTGSGWNKEFGNGKIDAKAAVDAVTGGGANCATTSGDANQDNAVNVLDLVATVNDILGTVPLGTGRACADINGDNLIRVDDVVGIVNAILAARRLPLPGDIDSGRPIAWAESIEQSSFRFAFEAGRVGGLQMTYILPRGYEASGKPRLVGANPGTSIETREANGQTLLIAYNQSGALAADSKLALEVPYSYSWDGDASARDFAVTSLLMVDRRGETLALAEEPSPEIGVGDGREIASLLRETRPNPVHGLTEVNYDLAVSGPVTVSLYDAAGRKVRELYQGYQIAGAHRLQWDGRDASGRELPDGAYFLKLATSRGGDSQKVLVLK